MSINENLTRFVKFAADWANRPQVPDKLLKKGAVSKTLKHLNNGPLLAFSASAVKARGEVIEWRICAYLRPHPAQQSAKADAAAAEEQPSLIGLFRINAFDISYNGLGFSLSSHDADLCYTEASAVFDDRMQMALHGLLYTFPSQLKQAVWGELKSGLLEHLCQCRADGTLLDTAYNQALEYAQDEDEIPVPAPTPGHTIH